jgi:mutator protein MutT
MITHCPHCSSTALDWPSAKQFTCRECGFVLFLNIAAAVGVIIECQGKLLFGVRKHEPQRGKLDLPGGFVDQGETAEQALQRELQEEIGLTIPAARYLYSFPNRYPYRGITYDTLDLIFLVQLVGFPPLQAGDDLAELLWLDRDSIDLEQIGFTSLRQAVQRYLTESGGLSSGKPLTSAGCRPF